MSTTNNLQIINKNKAKKKCTEDWEGENRKEYEETNEHQWNNATCACNLYSYQSRLCSFRFSLSLARSLPVDDLAVPSANRIRFSRIFHHHHRRRRRWFFSFFFFSFSTRARAHEHFICGVRPAKWIRRAARRATILHYYYWCCFNSGWWARSHSHTNPTYQRLEVFNIFVERLLILLSFKFT